VRDKHRPVEEQRRIVWARALVAAGWLLVFAYLAQLTGQIRLAFAISDSAFDDGVFGLRVERIAFMVFPQNVLVLFLAAGAGAGASALVRGLVDHRQMWLAQLVRIAAGVCYVVIAIGFLRIVIILTHRPDGVGDFSATLNQLAGILVAIAAIRISLTAEREA
jgi:hypothetical protein